MIRFSGFSKGARAKLEARIPGGVVARSIELWSGLLSRGREDCGEVYPRALVALMALAERHP